MKLFKIVLFISYTLCIYGRMLDHNHKDICDSKNGEYMNECIDVNRFLRKYNFFDTLFW